jgi:hypothetical protein
MSSKSLNSKLKLNELWFEAGADASGTSSSMASSKKGGKAMAAADKTTAQGAASTLLSQVHT